MTRVTLVACVTQLTRVTLVACVTQLTRVTLVTKAVMPSELVLLCVASRGLVARGGDAVGDRWDLQQWGALVRPRPRRLSPRPEGWAHGRLATRASWVSLRGMASYGN